MGQDFSRGRAFGLGRLQQVVDNAATPVLPFLTALIRTIARKSHPPFRRSDFLCGCYKIHIHRHGFAQM
jgi:hypothetical protein